MPRLTIEEIREAKKKKDKFYRTILKINLPENLQKLDERMKVFVGGCVERGVGSSFRHQAHAHNYKEDENFGWICFRSIKRIGHYEIVNYANGCEIFITKPSQLVLHEVAHILAPNQYHTKTWLNRYIELGATKGNIIKAKNRWRACN